jgi:peroxiredoxin
MNQRNFFRCLSAAVCFSAIGWGCSQRATNSEPATEPTGPPKVSKYAGPEEPEDALAANDAEEAEASEDRDESVQPPAAGAAQPTFADQLDPAELIMPKVQLTERHAETCLAKVGDVMPDLRLPDLKGQEQSLSKLLGSKLTVVLFWRSGHPYDVEELADLGPDVSVPYAAQGVRVVAINEEDPPDRVREIVQRVGADFPVLLDSEGKGLAQVASQKLPRTYLLDPSGKIVWFDIEYSRSTRRDLMRAIRFTLSEP